MQCPGMHKEQVEMYEHIYRHVPEIRKRFADESQNVFFWLLGRNIDDISEESHIEYRRIAGMWIHIIYCKAVKSRCGVG